MPQNLTGSWQPDALSSLARKLRREQTDAERSLWMLLRARPGGMKFRRQQPIGRYILDFFCPEARLAIEADGGKHYSREGLAADEDRSRFLAERGIRVIRFSDREILLERDGVLRAIEAALGLGERSGDPHQNPLPEERADSTDTPAVLP